MATENEIEGRRIALALALREADKWQIEAARQAWILKEYEGSGTAFRGCFRWLSTSQPATNLWARTFACYLPSDLKVPWCEVLIHLQLGQGNESAPVEEPPADLVE